MSFTIELGSSFDPPYSAVEGLWQENRGPALYLLKIADDPAQAHGPEITNAQAAMAGPNLVLTAVLSDVDNGRQDIALAEFFVDALGDPGMGGPLTPVDGAFDSPREEVMGTLPWPGQDRHFLYLRGQDSEGQWGPVSAVLWTGYQFFLPIVME